jgi:hypothetical protein
MLNLHFVNLQNACLRCLKATWKQHFEIFTMVSMYNDISGHPQVKFPNIIIWEISGVKMETWALLSCNGHLGICKFQKWRKIRIYWFDLTKWFWHNILYNLVKLVKNDTQLNTCYKMMYQMWFNCDTSPSFSIHSIAIPRWKQWKDKESGYAPWLV